MFIQTKTQSKGKSSFKPRLVAGRKICWDSSHNERFPQVHERLHQDSVAKAVRLKELQDEQSKEHTFKASSFLLISSLVSDKVLQPTVNPLSRLDMPSSIFDRLHQEHDLKQAKLEVQREEQTTKELEACTHQPSICDRSRDLAARYHALGIVDDDIYERLYPAPSWKDPTVEGEVTAFTLV